MNRHPNRIRSAMPALLLGLAAALAFAPAANASDFLDKLNNVLKHLPKPTPPSDTGTTAPSATAPGSNDPGTAAQTPQAAADLSSPELKALYRKLDVGGVQLGMTPEQAQAALQGRNRALAPRSDSFVVTDLPNTRFTSRISFQQPGSMAELVRLYLTLQPMQPQVMSISRGTKYTENNLPTIASTVAALRAKYGPETTRKTLNKSSQDTILYWIFDGEGQLVPKSVAENHNRDLLGWCAAGQLTLDVGHGIAGGFAYQKFCAPLTVVRADLGEWVRTRKNSHGQLLPPGMLFQMSVFASSYPMYAQGVTATRNMILAAKDARQQKEKEAAGARVPTL